MVEVHESNEHKVVLNGRRHLTICGIKSVNGFNETQISVITSLDDLLFIEGNELSVSEVNLDKGIIEATGKVSALVYEDSSSMTSKKNGLLRGLFSRQ